MCQCQYVWIYGSDFVGYNIYVYILSICVAIAIY